MIGPTENVPSPRLTGTATPTPLHSLHIAACDYHKEEVSQPGSAFELADIQGEVFWQVWSWVISENHSTWCSTPVA